MKFKVQKFEEIKQNCKGLGDLVSMVADPVKQAIIKHAPKSISEAMKNCNCSKRREYLNSVLPFKKS